MRQGELSGKDQFGFIIGSMKWFDFHILRLKNRVEQIKEPRGYDLVQIHELKDLIKRREEKIFSVKPND